MGQILNNTLYHRNTTIDIAKGIGSILVVLGHNWFVLGDRGELHRIIFSFHIPLFLFISGMFIKDTVPARRFIISRAEILLKPYLMIYLMLGLLQFFTPANSASSSMFFLSSLYATPGYIIWEWLPLWYIPHLFIGLVLSKVILQSTINSAHRQIWILGIIVLFLAVGIWITTTTWLTLPRPPFTTDVILISTSAILAGFLLKEKIFSMTLKWHPFLIAICIFFLLHYRFDETVDLSLRTYTHPIISTIQIILGIYITFAVSLLLNKFRLVRQLLIRIGSGSLFILLFHNFFQVHTYWTLIRWGYAEVIGYVISFIFGVIFPIVLLELIKRQNLLKTMFLPRSFKTS